MTYIGNYVINKSNIVKQNDNTYRLTHTDSVLSIRDKTLNRGKRLFAKIQACNINVSYSGLMNVEYVKKNGTYAYDCYITFDLCKGDLLTKINEYMTKLYELEDDYLFINFENLENNRIRINTIMDKNIYQSVQFIFDETLANFLGFEPDTEYKINNITTETLAPYPSLIFSNVIYFTHHNLIHSNFNRDNITKYEVSFEIRSLSPSINVEFFVYAPVNVNDNTLIKRRICPKDVCIILGFYEDEY